MFPRYSVRCPTCNAVVKLPYDSRYSELARRSLDGLYARVVRCSNGHLITVHIDGDVTLRRIGSGDAARGEDCELVGDVGFLPPAVRRRVEEALRSGDYRGVEKVIEDLRLMGVVRCLQQRLVDAALQLGESLGAGRGPEPLGCGFGDRRSVGVSARFAERF